jgi:ferredoxin
VGHALLIVPGPASKKLAEEECKKCYGCYNICPVKAISKDLKFDRKKCILCFCCYEVCPYKAVKMKKVLLQDFLLKRS